MTTHCGASPAQYSAYQMLRCPNGRAEIYRSVASTLRAKSQSLPLQMILRAALFFGIMTYLLYQLAAIGWAEIWSALPTSPLFYALSLGFVLAPVVAEVFSFQIIAQRRVGTLSRIFLRKHVLNKAVMNFSGDAYFLQKLAKEDGLGLRRAGIILKDMTIIRAFVANAWILLLGLAAIGFGNTDVLQNIAAVSPALALFVGLFCIGVVSGGLLLFRKLTRLDIRTAGKVAAIYVARSLVIGAILITQWSLAIPGTELANWFVFLLVFYIAKKSPVGGELLFASVIVSLPGLGGDTAAIAAMLIAIAAVSQLFYFIGFLATLETGVLRR